jgi:hypothetical protein
MYCSLLCFLYAPYSYCILYYDCLRNLLVGDFNHTTSLWTIEDHQKQTQGMCEDILDLPLGFRFNPRDASIWSFRMKMRPKTKILVQLVIFCFQINQSFTLRSDGLTMLGNQKGYKFSNNTNRVRLEATIKFFNRSSDPEQALLIGLRHSRLD